MNTPHASCLDETAFWALLGQHGVARQIGGRTLTVPMEQRTQPLWARVGASSIGTSKAVHRLFDQGPADVGVMLDCVRFNWQRWLTYLHLATRRGGALILGMNPGPNGMGQTGIPFTDPGIARALLDIPENRVRPGGTPRLAEHIVDGETMKAIRSIDEPESRETGRGKNGRPLFTYTAGLGATRQEPSARRLWRALAEVKGFGIGPAADWSSNREALWSVARSFMMINLCPMLFIGTDGKNVSSADIEPYHRRSIVEPAAERWLEAVVRIVEPRVVVQMGTWVTMVSKRTLRSIGYAGRVVKLLHPSPMSRPVEDDWRRDVLPELESIAREIE